ncbi:hypothetical protein HPB49_007900 [Dermacentor silvarum]|uniref:Uncharacterized protein n=1 Tax=Dermacentor silvarum TaxID=543639 RepID=A0ACB8DMT2_DERSI|nr:hypothetical protein HPB49_007900 [Dermacentor silvarum]
MAFAGIAPPDPFLPTPGRSVQPWSRWHDMFKVCLVASGASEFSPERRRALLLHSLGPEGQRIFNTLSVSQAAEKTEEEKGSAATPDMYESAVAALAKHFDTTCNLVVEHHQFHCRIQSPGESIQEYMTALTELAVKCLFTSQEESLRDQFVAGTGQSTAARQAQAAKPTMVAVGDMVRVKKPSVSFKGDSSFSKPRKVIGQRGRATFDLDHGKIWNAAKLCKVPARRSGNNDLQQDSA